MPAAEGNYLPDAKFDLTYKFQLRTKSDLHFSQLDFSASLQASTCCKHYTGMRRIPPLKHCYSNQNLLSHIHA